MSDPLISVIIPIYNAAETLEQCLRGVFNQTYKNFEIIAVNDGSNDKSAEILRKYNDKIKIINQSNAGAATARNAGAKVALGDYLIFIDADSTLNKSLLEKMLNALQKNSQVSYAYCAFKFGVKNFHLWPFSSERLKKMPYIHTSSLIKKSAFPGFDQTLKRFQDWDLYLTMLENGHIGTFIPEILFSIKDNGTMSSWLPKFFYKFSFLPSVKKYKEAEKIIKKKHNL